MGKPTQGGSSRLIIPGKQHLSRCRRLELNTFQTFQRLGVDVAVAPQQPETLPGFRQAITQFLAVQPRHGAAGLGDEHMPAAMSQS